MWIFVPAIPYQRLPSTTEIGSSQNWRGRTEHVRFHSQHPPWFNYHNNARGRQQTVELLAMNSSHYHVSSSSLRSQRFFLIKHSASLWETYCTGHTIQGHYFVWQLTSPLYSDSFVLQPTAKGSLLLQFLVRRCPHITVQCIAFTWSLNKVREPKGSDQRQMSELCRYKTNRTIAKVRLTQINEPQPN